MPGKRILLEQKIEPGIEPILRNFPRHQGALGQIRRQKSLTHPTNHTGCHHRPNAFQDRFQRNTRLCADGTKGIALEPLKLILGDRED